MRGDKKTTWPVTSRRLSCSDSPCQNRCSRPHSHTRVLVRHSSEASFQSRLESRASGSRDAEPLAVFVLFSLSLPTERASVRASKQAPHGACRWINPPAAINHQRWRLLDNVRRVKRAPHPTHSPPSIPAPDPH